MSTAADGRSAVLGRRGTGPFSLLGVTWTDPSVRVAGPIEVRTRDAADGAWSGWLRLDGDGGRGEGGAVRGGTEPAWVGPSDGVEVRVAGNEAARLPRGLRLDMINPVGAIDPELDPETYERAETLPGPLSDLTPGTAPGPDSRRTPGLASAQGAASAQGTDSDWPQVLDLDRSLAEDPGLTWDPRSTPDLASAQGTDSDWPQVLDRDPSLAEDPGLTRDLRRNPNRDSNRNLIRDPGPAPTVGPAPSSSPSSSSPPPPMSAEAAAPRPPITSRAGWGADESISPEGPIYLPGGKIKAVVVHHTAESNDYTCAQAPAVIRAIYAYHVKQLGWRDIGYNFLVDKCGTVYEGRKGGVDRPVMGAHAYGFNAETTGISVLGTFTSGAPSKEAMTSVARLAAWKLGQYGVDPAGIATLVAGADGTNYFGKSWKKGAALSFPAIHSHRDGYNTQCPGDAFYAQLPTIRTWAAGPVTGLALKAPGGVSQSGAAYYTKAAVTMNWAATTPTSLISRYEVLVDGTPAVTAVGSAISAQANLAAGTHQVSVRAVHQSGRTSTTPALTVIADTTAPTFPTKPNLALRTGTVNTAAVPLTLNWKAADNVLLKEVKLTAPVAATYGPAVTSADHTAKSGAATTWSLTAHDQAGNTATASVAGTPEILQETSATRTGTWAVKSSANYLGGQSLTSSTKNASLTWTFTGRSAAWVVSRATGSGQADIYVDGVKATTVDLKSAATVYRDAIWTRTWSASGAHTVKIVVVGTSGRPTLTTDGLVHLK